VFVVGDKKQAIYAWRGGDYRVFDAIEKSLTLIRISLAKITVPAAIS